MPIEVKYCCPNDHLDWDEFEKNPPQDLLNAYGWFYVTIGEVGSDAGNDFQVCVATPRAVGRLKASGMLPGILVDSFDTTSIRQAIDAKVCSAGEGNWRQALDRLRTFMHWEYEGMDGID
ncbi:Imm8 family immunity protein [Blastopirellula marina]|uniref:Uncharacterized protein n=1 Tax=Blastopirellula marina TaxID=124 RepID=A0A2S8GEX5_9BACT|nr:Imm8 family immunity protein [Blastopirellula marina]PQO42811.1 hypothetical protein C5Y98_01255 [Blastopirellula marina]PTL46577.1 hypothetical protein C5Y97_01255 [Blastopirellula marina]